MIQCILEATSSKDTMGLFSKLKSSMNGGVEVHLQAPSAVPSNQVIPVTIAITSDTSQTINSVKAEIKAQARETGIAMGGGQGVGVQQSQTTDQTVAQVESREQFNIGPGETKTINLQLYLNGGAAGVGPLGQAGNLGGVLQAVSAVAQNFGHVNYIYSVHASVDVKGHSLNPSDKQPIQVLPPTEAVPQSQSPQIENLQSQDQATAQAAPSQVQPPSQPSQPVDSDPANPAQ
jgi:hypothetical protein